MLNRSLTALLTLISLMFFSACKKAPGEGGFGTISGKVYVKNYDATFTVVQSEYYLPGENVYIIYGDGTEVGNTVKTSYDGSFVFNYLQKGKYKIFVVSEDTTKPSLSVPTNITIETEIKSKKQKVDLGVITIAE